MATLVYDGSWPGFLTTVFEVYERKLKEVNIERADFHQPSLLDQSVTVATDHIKAERVSAGLRKRTVAGISNLYAAYLSETGGIENYMLKYIMLVFSVKGNEQAFADPSVLKIMQVAKMVMRESHRMKAFVRFMQGRDNIYFAAISPDFNVLPLVVSHFEKRFADQKWVIYDERRRYGIYYDLKEAEEVIFPEGFGFSPKESTYLLSEGEIAYQSLWKEYYKSTTIVSRLNTRLHLRHVPRRYWKYLTEKYQ